GEVEEEGGAFAMVAEELDGFFGVEAGEVILAFGGDGAFDFFVADERKRRARADFAVEVVQLVAPGLGGGFGRSGGLAQLAIGTAHVVGVGEAEVVVEAVMG